MGIEERSANPKRVAKILIIKNVWGRDKKISIWRKQVTLKKKWVIKKGEERVEHLGLAWRMFIEEVGGGEECGELGGFHE